MQRRVGYNYLISASGIIVLLQKAKELQYLSSPVVLADVVHGIRAHMPWPVNQSGIAIYHDKLLKQRLGI